MYPQFVALASEDEKERRNAHREMPLENFATVTEEELSEHVLPPDLKECADPSLAVSCPTAESLGFGASECSEAKDFRKPGQLSAGAKEIKTEGSAVPAFTKLKSISDE